MVTCLIPSFFLQENMGNSADFPKRFPHGIFDGFWWAFVSMTTVGYVLLVTVLIVHKSQHGTNTIATYKKTCRLTKVISSRE